MFLQDVAASSLFGMAFFGGTSEGLTGCAAAGAGPTLAQASFQHSVAALPACFPACRAFQEMMCSAAAPGPPQDLLAKDSEGRIVKFSQQVRRHKVPRAVQSTAWWCWRSMSAQHVGASAARIDASTSAQQAA